MEVIYSFFYPIDKFDIKSKIRQMMTKSKGGGNKEKCSVCFPNDPETPLISEGLLNRMRAAKRLNVSREKGFDDGKTDFIDFHRLLKMVFIKKFKNFKPTHGCNHYELKREFASKLKCSFKELDRISDFIAWKISKINFHLDTVTVQVKNFTRFFSPKQKSEPLNLEEEETEQKLRGLMVESDMKPTIRKRILPLPNIDIIKDEQRDQRDGAEQKIPLRIANALEESGLQNTKFGNSIPENLHNNMFFPTFSSFRTANALNEFQHSSFQPMNLNWALMYPGAQENSNLMNYEPQFNFDFSNHYSYEQNGALTNNDKQESPSIKQGSKKSSEQ